MTFKTVHGAGNMAAGQKKQAVLQMINEFIFEMDN
jgi:hypothetical protein